MTDHDLLIAHSVKIDSLCEIMQSVKKQIELYSKNLDRKCDRTHDGITETHKEIFGKIDKKTDGTTFRWLVGILIIIMISLFGVVGMDIIQVNNNKKSIEVINEQTNDTRTNNPAPH